jgi:hypothetical protein
MGMFFKKYKQVRALKALFLLPDGELREEAKEVLCWLRDEVNAKGKRIDGNTSMLFNGGGDFDASKVVYWAGQRRIYDLIVHRLAIDDKMLFSLVAEESKREQELMEDLTSI